jgi:hypothetical protein
VSLARGLPWKGGVAVRRRTCHSLYVTEIGSFDRLGKPGGPSAELSASEIRIPGMNGEPLPGHLLDAGPESTEVGLLRAVCAGIGVRWGQDERGWWAVVPG